MRLSLAHVPSLPQHDPKEETLSQNMDDRDATRQSLLTRILNTAYNSLVSPVLRSTAIHHSIRELWTRPTGDSFAGETPPRLARASLLPTAEVGGIVCMESTLDKPLGGITPHTPFHEYHHAPLLPMPPSSSPTYHSCSVGFTNTVEQHGTSDGDASAHPPDALEQLVVQYETDGGVRIAGGPPGERAAVESVHPFQVHVQTLTLPPPYSSLTTDP